MAIFLFFLIVLICGFAAFRLLAPKQLLLLPEPTIDHLPAAIDTPLQPEETEILPVEKFNKMEALLLEKNKMIDRLFKELEAERSHRGEFDKVKNIMDAQMMRLKEQIKTLKQQEKAHA